MPDDMGASYAGSKDMGSSYGSSATQLDPISSVLETARAGVVEAGELPFKAINAVLGAPQRAVAGTIAGWGEPGQTPLGMATYGVFHPNDERFEQRAEEKTLRSKAPENGFLAGARSFGFQTATDPLTYLGGAGLLENIGK